MSEFDDTFFGLWGDPVEAERLEFDPRVVRRAQRIAQRNGHGQSRSGISLQEVAAGIAASLRRGDQYGAQQLIEAGAAVFGSGPLVAQVGLAAHRLETDALRAANGQYPAIEPDPAEWDL